LIALVTGVAGFVGSHLAEALLAQGHEVRGVDCLTPYYDRALKERNLFPLHAEPGFSFGELDLTGGDMTGTLQGVDVVFHLAGQPGVRPSWGREFGDYVRHNIAATQRLLEACVEARPGRFVFASSSSVYGDAERYPTLETARPQPVSPYGVTKLAAEHLCDVYRTSFGLPTASLRLFTVYGPRQRPDMAFRRLIGAAVAGTDFELYGDGSQTRDFTYVGDVVQAMIACAASHWCGTANIGGGARTSMNDVVSIVEELCGPVDVRRGGPQPGDVSHTAADVSIAAEAFGYRPRITLREGLASMVAWERQHADPNGPAAVSRMGAA